MKALFLVLSAFTISNISIAQQKHFIIEDQKYNLRHIGTLKRVFGLKSLDDFFPNGIPADEQIIIRYKKVPKKKADGTDSKLFETVVVDIVLAEEETKAASNKRKKR